MNERFHVRIDNRLLHGQVVQFWIPHLGIEHLIVADDEISGNAAMQTVYRMALPKIVDLTVVEVDRLGEHLLEDDQRRTLLLIRDIETTERILARDVFLPRLTLGNVHASPERDRVTDAVYLSEAEVISLTAMAAAGIYIEIQTFPGEVLRFVSPEKGGPGWEK
jgi:mannose/fructose/N-acetylgalactosamine-specific phosphotransferase system component IIB